MSKIVFYLRFPTLPRLVVSQIVIVILFVFCDVMAVIDTDQWQTTFLAVTLAAVVAINVCVALFQVNNIASMGPAQA